jgi:hypothetical protein
MVFRRADGRKQSGKHEILKHTKKNRESNLKKGDLIKKVLLLYLNKKDI